MNELLEKLNKAIEECECNKIKENSLTLTYAELNLLRRYEMTNDYASQLAVDNLKRARETFK